MSYSFPGNPTIYSETDDTAIMNNIHPGLTFGIELEFILIFDPQQFPNAMSDARGNPDIDVRDEDSVADVAARSIMVTELSRLISIHAPSPVEYDEDMDYSIWNLDSEALRLSPKEEMLRPKDWIAVGMELISRKFNFMTSDWRHEVREVCTLLNSLTHAQGLLALVNTSTGFHVHVGLENGYERQTVLNVMQLTAAYEKVFDRIHSASRIIESPWCRGPSELWVYGERGYEERMRSVSGQSNTEPCSDLVRHLRAIRRLEYGGDISSLYGPLLLTSAVNLDHLAMWRAGTPHETKKGTIEFRQHRGTTDMVEIFNWVQVVCRLVTFAAHADRREMDSIVGNWEDADYGLYELLEDLEVHEDVVNFYAGRWTKRSQQQMFARIYQAWQICENDPGIDGPLGDLIYQNHFEKAADDNACAVEMAISEKLSMDSYGLQVPHDAPLILQRTSAPPASRWAPRGNGVQTFFNSYHG